MDHEWKDAKDSHKVFTAVRLIVELLAIQKYSRQDFVPDCPVDYGSLYHSPRRRGYNAKRGKLIQLNNAAALDDLQFARQASKTIRHHGCTKFITLESASRKESSVYVLRHLIRASNWMFSYEKAGESDYARRNFTVFIIHILGGD